MRGININIEVDNIFDIIQAISRPLEIISSGISFNHRGTKNMDDDIGDSQDIVLPAMIDIDDKAIIGLIIFNSSFTDRRAGPELGLHMVDIVNRTE